MSEHEAASCPRCESPMRGETVRTAIWRQEQLFVVEDIPAHVCGQCMEQFYDEETTDRLRRLTEEGFANATPRREIRVPIYSLTAVLAVLLLTACGGGAPAPASAPAPVPAAETKAAFNVKSIFPEGAGRDLVLATCGACH